MKKIFLVILLILELNDVFAQYSSVDGVPFGFYALGGTQYNPGSHPQGYDNCHYSNYWVITAEDRDWSVNERAFFRECFDDNYPGHTILEGSTTAYNCHGFSHSIFQGGERCKIIWYSELCSLGFVPVQTPQKDDIAVIRTNAYQNEFDAGSIHSSVVVNEDTLISKWGDGPLTKHHKNDVIGIINLGTTLQAFLQSGKLTDANDLNYIYDKARKL